MKVGRNEPCPCGSGNKFKKCCLNKPFPNPEQEAELEADLALGQQRIQESEMIYPTAEKPKRSPVQSAILASAVLGMSLKP